MTRVATGIDACDILPWPYGYLSNLGERGESGRRDDGYVDRVCSGSGLCWEGVVLGR